MTSRTNFRGNFLKSGGSVIGVSWLAVNTPLILLAGQTAHTKSAEQAAYENLSREEAAELGAIVDQIFPPDETPGAMETGVVYFIDEALAGFMAGVAPMLRAGIKDLQHKASGGRLRNRLFSELSFEHQTGLLREVEDSPFFNTLHFLTMLGMFCLPKYGGNRDNAGWNLLGFDHRHAWQPPFGFYDTAAQGKRPMRETILASTTSVPLKRNNISLDPALKDDKGRAAIRMTYMDHDDDLAMATFLQDRAVEILSAAGAEEIWRNPVVGGTIQAHLLGTCRMGNDPATSVVDKYHRAHDISNLFICDGSSFVSSGRGQPTMTIQALAFRAVEHITRFARREEI